MAIQQRNIVDDFRLIGVFSSAANFLAALVNEDTAAEGMCYYDTTLNQLRTYDGTSWSAAGQNGNTAGSINDAFTTGQKITIAGTAGLEIEATDAAIGANGQLLLLDNNDTGADIHCLECDVIAGNTAPAIQITNATTSTKDINGTGNSWYFLGTGYGAAAGFSLGDDVNLYLGGTAGTGDVTISFNDSVSLGTSGAGILIEAVAADEQICIGSSTFAFDVYFSGESDFQNNMLWDMDGGIDSLGALQFDNTDVLFGDDDAIVFGDGADLILQSDGSDIQLTTSTNDTAIVIGNGTKDFDITWYAGSTGDYVLFDQSGVDIDIIDVDVGFDDDAVLQFGTGDDVTIQYVSGSKFSILSAAVADMPFVLGGTTYGFDITYYFEGSGTIETDYDANILALDGADLRIENDDYLLLGDSSTSSQQCIRWDSTDTKIEVIGATRFESAVTMDGNLTVGGTLATTGSWNPGALGLGDGENLTFGDDSDATIDYDHTSTSGVVINGLSNFMKVYFGYGKSLDVIFTGSAANLTWDGSADALVVDDSASLRFGDDSDVIFTASSNNLTISCATANDQIWFGSGDTTYLDICILHPGTTGADFWWDLSGQELFVGEDGKGWDCTWYAEEASDYMKWDMDANTNLGELIFEDSAIHMQDDTNIYFGDGRDWALDSDGTNLIFQEGSAAGKAVHFGLTGTGCDVQFFGDNYDLLWDQGNDALFFADNAELGIGGSAGTHDLQLHSDGATAVLTGTVNTHFLADAKVITFGGTGSSLNGTDVTFYSATKGNTIKFDAAANTLTLSGIAQVFDSGAVAYTFSTSGTDSTYGTSSLIITATDNANAKIQIGISQATNGLDLQWQSSTSGEYVTFDAALGTMTLTDIDLVFGGSTVFYNMNASTSDLLRLYDTASGADAKLVFGISGTNSLDVEWQASTSGETVTFDGGGGTMTMTDVDLVFAGSTISYTIATGTSDLLTIVDSACNANAKIQIGVSGDNSVDVALHGSTSGEYVTFDGGAGTLTLTDIDLVFGGSTVFYHFNSSTSDLLRIYDTASGADAKMVFGISGTNSLDVMWQASTSGENVTFDGGSGNATFTDVDLVFAGSTVSYTVSTGTSDLLLVRATDNGDARLEFGLSGTNSLDIVFHAAASGSNLVWDAGTRMFQNSTTGAGFRGVGGSGVWEHAMIVPSGSAAPSTSIANGSGAIFYSHDASKIYVFTGSSWAGVAVAE